MPTIKVADQILEVAICPRGCKVWPPSSMAMHVAQHKKRDGKLERHDWRAKRGVPRHKAGRRPKAADTPARDVNIPQRASQRAKYVDKQIALEHIRQLEKALRRSPGQSIAELARLDSPYQTANACRDAISKAILNGDLAVRIEKIGVRTKLWPL